MNGPVDERDLMIVLQKFEKHLLRSNVPGQNKGSAHPDTPCLVPERDAFRNAIAELGEAPPIGAKRIPTNQESPREAEFVVRDDYPAIEPDLRNERLQPAEAASREAAASNAREDSIGRLQSGRPQDQILAPNPRSVLDYKVGSKRILSLGAALGAMLVSLGALIVYWDDAPSELDTSGTLAATGISEPPTTSMTSAAVGDTAASATPYRSSSEEASGIREQTGGALGMVTPPSPDSSGVEKALEDETAIPSSKPSQTPTQSVNPAALPEAKKMETAPVRPDALRASSNEAAIGGPSPVAATPTPARKTTVRAPKPQKAPVATKSIDRREPVVIAKPAQTIVPENVAKPLPTQLPNTQAESPAPQPPIAVESSGPVAYIQRAQRAVTSIPGVVKNWVGIGPDSRP